VWDLDGVPMREDCGANRVFPAPWFLLCQRETLLAVGGWDEQYLGGMAFDDNDIAGRLALASGWVFISDKNIVYHQSHDMDAYANTRETHAGWARNREYTRMKWGGIPFDKSYTPMNVIRRPHPSGRMAFQVSGAADLLDHVVQQTQGLLSRAR